MPALLISLNLPKALAAPLRARGLATAGLERRRFPDGESYLRIVGECSGRDVIVACTLNEPDEKLAPLLFVAETAREMGARCVGLVAPYLAYMRQDAAFERGESISARHFARLVSRDFDWLVTIDPHLHRLGSLDEIYGIPTRVVRAAPAIAEWIVREVPEPLLIGPDEESAQWVHDIAARTGAPFRVLRKTRRGDREVDVSALDAAGFARRTPIVVDDIVSSGHTMLQTIRRIREAGLQPPVCIAVHGIFADTAATALYAAGAARVLSCNTVEHPTNEIDVGELLADGVLAALAGAGGHAPCYDALQGPGLVGLHRPLADRGEE